MNPSFLLVLCLCFCLVHICTGRNHTCDAHDDKIPSYIFWVAAALSVFFFIWGWVSWCYCCSETCCKCCSRSGRYNVTRERARMKKAVDFNDYKEVAISADNNERFPLEQAMNEHNSFISKPLETTATHVNVPALVLNIPSLIVNLSATSALPSQEKDAISSFQIAEVSEVPSPKKSDDVQDDAKPCKKESEEKLALEINSSPQNSSFVIPIAKEHVETTNDSKEVQAQEKVHDSKEVHIDDSEDEDSKVPEYNKSNDHIICEPTLPDACEKLNMRSDSNEQMDVSDSEDEDSKAPEYNKSNDHIICEPTLPDTCEKLNMRSDSFEQMDASGTTSHPYERINMSLLDAPSHPYETIKRDDSYEDMNVSSFQYERVDFSS